MVRLLLTPYPENATIEELKAVSRIGSNETATRCTAIQIILADYESTLGYCLNSMSFESTILAFRHPVNS
jgi:hypothetical protein